MSIRNKLKIPDEAMSAMVYLFSSVLTKGLAIITVPIFTRIMPPSQVGIVSVFTSWYAILSGVVTLGLTSGGLMMSLNKFSNEKNSYLSSVLTLTSGSGLIFGIFFLIFSGTFEKILNLPRSLIMLMVLCFVFHPAYDFWLAAQRYDYKYKLSGILMISSSILASVSAVIAVLIFPQNNILSYAEARLFGTYFISLSVAIVIWIIIFLKGRTLIRKEYWKYSLVLGLPLIGQMFAAQILGLSDRIMIEKYCGDSEVGIYSTIYTIGTLTTMLWTALNSTFTPYIYKNIENNSKSVKKNSFLIIITISLISIAVVLLGPEITRIIGPGVYHKGVYIVPPVAAGVYLIAISDLYSDLLIYEKKTHFIMLGTVVAAVLNVALNAFFIPKRGYIVAAFTTLISYVVMAFFLIIFTRKIYKKQKIDIDEIFAQKKIFLLSFFTIMTDLLCMVTYSYSIIRYLIIGVIFLLIVFLIKKYNLNTGQSKVLIKIKKR